MIGRRICVAQMKKLNISKRIKHDAVTMRDLPARQSQSIHVMIYPFQKSMIIISCNNNPHCFVLWQAGL